MTNDKVYELAKQAGMIEFESIPGSAAVTPDYESVVRARKFAELIIMECAVVLDDKLLNTNGANMAYCDGSDLLEHFGVQE